MTATQVTSGNIYNQLESPTPLQMTVSEKRNGLPSTRYIQIVCFFLVHQLSSIIINRINFPQRSILKPWLSSDTVLGPVGREQALPSAALGQTTQQKGRRRHQNLQQEAICYISQSLQLHRIHLNSMYFIVFLYAFLMCFWLFLSCWMVWADFNGLPIIGTARLCTAAKEANIFVASPKDSYALQLSRCAPILFLLQTYFSSKCATTLRQQLIAGQASYSLLWGNAAALGRVSVQYAASRERKRNDNGHDSQAFIAHAFMTIIDDCDILS